MVRRLCAVLALLVATAVQASAPAMDAVAFMAGHWEGKAEGTVTEEVWLAPSGGMMLGLHRDVFPDGKAFFEYLRIEVADGTVTYFASPRGAEPTAFKLTEASSNRARFSNPKHDFPQHIEYWIDGKDGAMHARIEGVVKGKTSTSEWVWGRRKP